MGRPVAELNRKQRVALAHAIADAGVWGVSLIGGEPTLVDELGDLAAVLKARGVYVSLGTSGRNIESHLGWLVETGVDTVTFSVDSHRSDEHDRFRGLSGLFHQVEAAASTLRRQRRNKRPQIQVRCTIHRGNFRHLISYVDYWQEKVDGILLQIVQDNGIHSVRDHDVMFRPEDRLALERSLADLQKAHPWLRSPYLDMASRYVFEPDALYKDIGFRCLLVPATSMTILPNGDVKLCYGREDSRVGNVTKLSIRELWAHRATQATRKRMQSAEYGCMCWEQACSGNLTLVKAQRKIADFITR